jgi:hypothetical protein
MTKRLSVPSTESVIEPTDTASATIHVWDWTGNRKSPVKAMFGDVIDYKRNGQLGTLRCTVTRVSPEIIQLQPEDGGRKFSVPTSSHSFSRLYRMGKRIEA